MRKIVEPVGSVVQLLLGVKVGNKQTLPSEDSRTVVPRTQLKGGSSGLI